MCAISGIFSPLSAVSRLNERIRGMTDSMSHRGPDASGISIKGSGVALGHRRLKIVDLSERSAQPMQSQDGRYTIVFNGEIYNFKEIRAELSYPFRSEGDTEVILAALQLNGLEWFLERANGMFAIAVYDAIEESMLLLRDRLGVKPLYYCVTEGALLFASEIKGILNSGLIEAQLFEPAIDSYLANRYVVEPNTFFEGIFQVPAAHHIKFDKNLKSAKSQYWTRPRFAARKTDETELLEALDNLVCDAVKLRLRSDVPLGTYLSGGVDSSLITAIASIELGKPVESYTIGFEEEGYNEFDYARIVAEKYKTRHHEITISYQNYLAEWDRQIEFKDSPLGVPNEVPLALMTQELKKDITVVLSGEGADELFGGYGRIYQFPFEYSKQNRGISYSDAFLSEYEYVPRSIRNQVLNDACFSLRSRYDGDVKALFEDYGKENGIQHFFHEYHIKGLLSRLDANTMQASVEARGPFLDYRLLEFAYRDVPAALRVKWKDSEAQSRAEALSVADYSEVLDTPKYLLKKMSEKYLPSEIIYRKKVGFPVPLNTWFGNMKNAAQEILKEAAWIKPGSLDTLLNEAQTSARAGQVLWMFINVEKFRKKYFDRSWKW